jgi:hypothetical protein
MGGKIPAISLPNLTVHIQGVPFLVGWQAVYRAMGDFEILQLLATGQLPQFPFQTIVEGEGGRE